jgi:hypothetical protein
VIGAVLDAIHVEIESMRSAADMSVVAKTRWVSSHCGLQPTCPLVLRLSIADRSDVDSIAMTPLDMCAARFIAVPKKRRARRLERALSFVAPATMLIGS